MPADHLSWIGALMLVGVIGGLTRALLDGRSSVR